MDGETSPLLTPKEADPAVNPTAGTLLNVRGYYVCVLRLGGYPAVDLSDMPKIDESGC